MPHNMGQLSESVLFQWMLAQKEYCMYLYFGLPVFTDQSSETWEEKGSPQTIQTSFNFKLSEKLKQMLCLLL